MKTIITILFVVVGLCMKAQDSTSVYRKYLETEACRYKVIRHIERMPPKPQVSITPIPRYQIPKGSVFCRMEDKLNRATKVWIKVGTNNNK